MVRLPLGNFDGDMGQRDEIIIIDASHTFVAPVHGFKILSKSVQPEYVRAHPAQVLSITNCFQSIMLVDAKDDFGNVISTVAEQLSKLPVKPMMTFCGVEVRQDPSMKEDELEFRQGDQIVARIINLATPQI